VPSFLVSRFILNFRQISRQKASFCQRESSTDSFFATFSQFHAIVKIVNRAETAEKMPCSRKLAEFVGFSDKMTHILSKDQFIVMYGYRSTCIHINNRAGRYAGIDQAHLGVVVYWLS
jgi:hypothetical protein